MSLSHYAKGVIKERFDVGKDGRLLAFDEICVVEGVFMEHGDSIANCLTGK